MEIVRTFEDAFAVGSACLAKINHSKPRPRLLDDYLLPLNLDNGPWEMSEEALYQTLSYIMNFLNHSCYMLCVNGDEQKMVKLETREMSQFFKDIVMTDVRKKQDAKINGALLDDKDRLKKMRIMQCVVKPYAASSGTSEEYNALFQKVRAPDGVYILNLTDAVLLRKNGLIPWKLNRNVQMPSAYRIEKFIPVLSISGEEGYWDIPIPNYDDVEYVLKDTHPDPKYELDWAKKKSKAVFRGGPTGCGVSENTNMRIKLAKMGLEPKYKDFLDVGIVSNKPDSIDSEAIRYDPRVGLAYMNTFLKPVARMPMSEQSTFKYIIHIDGNVHAYRLLTTMRTGSVILRVKSDYTSWIDHLLDQEEANGRRMYVPVRADLSNLISQIEYCDKNSDECKAIAERAKQFAEQAMTLSYVVNAVEAVMWKLKEVLKPGLVIGSVPDLKDKRYAIVGEDGGPKEYFTKSEGEKQWHADPLIQSIMKMNVRNSEDVLCVLQDMCFSTSLNSSNNQADECVSEEMAANKISTDLFKQFYHYFDDAYFLSKEELDHAIEKEATYSAQIYPVLEHIRNAEKLVNNNVQYRLGKTAILSSLPVSPNQEMVDLILRDKDESRKRRLIINLVESQKYVYLGNPAEDSTVYAEEKQNEWWYYCVQTHVKLVPRFLYLLATAVIRNPRDYDVVRSNLIQEIGEQTDDGIFDKHTGVFIEGINLVNTEVFDDSGFKVHTGAVLEKDEATRQGTRAKEEDENLVEDILFNDFENEDEHVDGDDETTLEVDESDLADSVAGAANKMDESQQQQLVTGNKMLDLLNEQTFRIAFSVPVMETFDLLTTELAEKLGDAYEQYLVKKPKEPYSRNDYMAIQETTYLLIIYIYMVELFLSKKQIMQKMDSEKGDKEEEASEPNKDKDATELLTQYIARRLIYIFKTLKKQRKIWPAIYMKKVMESSNKHKSIAALVNLKRGDVMKEPMATRLKQSIAQELSLRYVEKTKTVFPQTPWTQFLPPQHPQDLFGIQACSELQRTGTEGNKGPKHINTPFLFGKMIFLSFCIQRTIQEILNTDKYKDSLLLNIKVYNQMNSCCVQQIKDALSQTQFGSALEFFNINSPNENLIQRYNVLINKIEKQLLSVRSVTRSFLSNVDTEIPYPMISHKLNDVVMEEGLHFLSGLDVLSLTDNKDLSLHQQFLLDYVKYSRLTLRGPPVFADVKLPVIQLIRELKEDTDENNHGHFERLSNLLQKLYSKKKEGEDDGDDPLIMLKQWTAGRMKSMKRPKQAQLEKIFKKIEPLQVKEAKEAKEAEKQEKEKEDSDDDDIDVNNAYATMTFLKNYVMLIARVFPAMFKNKQMTAELSGKGLEDKLRGKNKNSSWFDFSEGHVDKLYSFSKALYANASAYIKSSVDAEAVAPYFDQIMEKTDVFVRLADTTYFQPTDKESVRYLFMVYLALFEYYIASIFDIYDATAKRMLKEMEEEGDADEDDETMQQIADAKTALLDFSLFYLNKTAEVDVANKAYQNIMDVVFKHKENEKNKFRKRLEKMSRDERIAYQDDRKLGIGEYNAKNYAGLKTYDAAFYDKTREVRDELQEQEDNFEEKESETMARADGQEEDGDYNNEFEEDGYY